MYRNVLYIFTWRGPAALLILEKGQCEDLNTGMGTEVEVPMPFLFPMTNLNMNAEFGDLGSKKHLILWQNYLTPSQTPK